MKLNTPLNFDKKPQTPLSLIGKSRICFFPMTNFSGGLVVPPSYWQCDETSFQSHSPTLSLVLYIPNRTRPMMVMTETVYLVAMLVTAAMLDASIVTPKNIQEFVSSSNTLGMDNVGLGSKFDLRTNN